MLPLMLCVDVRGDITQSMLLFYPVYLMNATVIISNFSKNFFFRDVQIFFNFSKIKIFSIIN